MNTQPEPDLPNVRMTRRMAEKRKSRTVIARRLGVHVRTVGRWMNGTQVPYEEHRRAVADMLGVEPEYLWPPSPDTVAAASGGELVREYAHRGQVPAELWTGILRDATTSVDVLVYAGLPWFESDPGVLRALTAAAERGVKVRLALGDPCCDAVARRGNEEGIDMAGRIRNALRLIDPILDLPGIEVRLHATTLYNSLYAADEEMLVNAHVLGVPAAHATVRHYQRVPGGHIFATYAQSFEATWKQAHPYQRGGEG